MTKQKSNTIYKLKLSKNKIALIDRVHKKRVKKYNWYAKFIKNTQSYYAVTEIYSKKDRKKKILQLHNFIMNFNPQKDKNLSVDHFNRDTLDDRESNLRIVNKSIQAINRKMNIKNTSGAIGVCLDTFSRCWNAKWYEKKKPKKQPFYYRDQESFELAFVKAFIFRKDKERELEDYRFAMGFLIHHIMELLPLYMNHILFLNNIWRKIKARILIFFCKLNKNTHAHCIRSHFHLHLC